jgi:hypothetical protein
LRIGEYAALSYPVKGTGRPGKGAFGASLGVCFLWSLTLGVVVTRPSQQRN